MQSRRRAIALGAILAALCLPAAAGRIFLFSKAQSAVRHVRWRGPRASGMEICVKSLLEKESRATGQMAETYCACVFDAMEPRWTPSDVAKHGKAIGEQLRAEGVMKTCRARAGANWSGSREPSNKARGRFGRSSS